MKMPAHMDKNTVIISKDRQWFFMAHICFQENIRNLKHVFIRFAGAKLIFGVWNVVYCFLLFDEFYLVDSIDTLSCRYD